MHKSCQACKKKSLTLVTLSSMLRCDQHAADQARLWNWLCGLGCAESGEHRRVSLAEEPCSGSRHQHHCSSQPGPGVTLRQGPQPGNVRCKVPLLGSTALWRASWAVLVGRAQHRGLPPGSTIASCTGLNGHMTKRVLMHVVNTSVMMTSSSAVSTCHQQSKRVSTSLDPTLLRKGTFQHMIQ